MKRIAIIILTLGLLLTGCGRTADSSGAYDTAEFSKGAMNDANGFSTAESAAAMDDEYAVEAEYDAAVEEGAAGGTAEEVTEADVDQGTKIIRNADLSMDVPELDRFSAKLKSTVEKYEGYVENSNISDYESDYAETRYGYFTVRIPAEKLDDFLSIVEGEGTVTSKGETAQDVTLKYVDLKAHIKTYEAERDSLMELLNKAESVEDILAIREQLNEINYELDSLKQQLKSMENKISYSTVTINAKETRSIMGTTKKKSFFAKFVDKFSEEFSYGWEMAIDVLIFLITRIPLFAILGCVIFLIVRFIRFVAGKSGHKVKKGKVNPGDGVERSKKENPGDGDEQSKKEAAEEVNPGDGGEQSKNPGDGGEQSKKEEAAGNDTAENDIVGEDNKDNG